MKVDLAIKGGQVVTAGGIFPLSVTVKGGKIVGLMEESYLPDAVEVVDAKGMYVLPGGVEPHTHIGIFLPYEKDMESETASAATGGITTVFNFIQTMGSYRDVLDDRVKLINEKAYVDVGFHAIINGPNHLDEMGYLSGNGIKSFKLYMAYGGEEGKFLNLFQSDEGILYEAFRKSAENGYLPMVHAENSGIYSSFTKKFQDRKDLAAYSEGRPPLAEDLDIRTACKIAEMAGSPLYIVHMGYGNGVDIVNEFRSRGNKIYLETCPHYLTVDKSGSNLKEPVSIKVAPPMKSKEDNDKMWWALGKGFVDTIGTDHCSNMWGWKKGEGDIWSAKPGFPSMGTRLPLILSEGVNKKRISLERAVEVLSLNPAKILGVYPRKGSIMIGADADFVIVDLKKKAKVSAEALHSASDYTPWEGWTLTGWPIKTIVRGKVVMDEGQIVGERGHGRFIKAE